MADPTPAPAFDPKGKTFLQRLDAFTADALSTYTVTVRRDSGRTDVWEQRLHICHMFLYNKYQSTTPANVDKGQRTIAWSHLSDATVTWVKVPFSDILKTAKDGFPTKDAKATSGWQKDMEPDKDATEKQAKKLLSDAGVGDSGQAMVACGIKPCAEPCGCGAGRSKHLEDLAADLNSTDLDTLTTKLTAAKAGDIDTYPWEVRAEPPPGEPSHQPGEVARGSAPVSGRCVGAPSWAQFAKGGRRETHS